jgi:glycosyltransferase involved in cell wall biosynthesis
MPHTLKNPKVSVCVITYNQEKYIRQCLQSLVDQVTDFDYEIIVGEDCSTDSTRSIVEEFASKYPELIRPIYQTENIGGGTHNFISVHAAARGKYIAHLDGDDYSFPSRLQMQAQILDEEPECNIVFHRMMLEVKDRSDMVEGPFKNDLAIHTRKFYRADLIQHPSIGWQSTKMYRRLTTSVPIPEFEISDVYTTVEQVSEGYARFAAYEALGVYRLQIGITNNRNRLATALSSAYMYFYKQYPQHRLEANTALLVYLLADLKNLRTTSIIYARAWIMTLHPCSLVRLFQRIDMIKKLIVKNYL